MDLSEKELRRSGRSTRRASYADNRDVESSYDDEPAGGQEFESPNKSRRSSVDDAPKQPISSINANTGVDESKHSFKFSMTKDAFLKDLYNFMAARGQPITKLPSLGYQELDLYLLYQLVIARGGMDDVTRKQEWKLVYQDLGIPTMSTSASYNTRTNYKKYLYLYELEHCDFPDKNRPKDAKPRYQIGEFIRIVSSVFEGQVFYARILKCRYREGKNQYYVHYNGWNSSHDEWMREDVLDPLIGDERSAPELLSNPPPSRSSKSNHLIYDPTISEKVISNLVNSHKSPKISQPLSPASPAAFKKTRKTQNNQNNQYYFEPSNGSSEEEEAANELLMGMERYAASASNESRYQSRSEEVYQPRQSYKPVEVIRYPMRADPGEDIAKIVEDKRDKIHEQDLIHRNRLHTHVLMRQGGDDDERERRMVADLLKSVRVRIEAGDCHEDYFPKEDSTAKGTKTRGSSNTNNNMNSHSGSSSSSINDPRSLHDIQESLVSLQASLLATQNSYKHALKALKKHHNVQTLPPPPPAAKKNIIGTRRSERM